MTSNKRLPSALAVVALLNLQCNAPVALRPSATLVPPMATAIRELTSTAIPPTMVPESEYSSVPLPPPEYLYHGIFVSGPSGEEDDMVLNDLRSYEYLVGKPAVWVYFSHNWYRGHEFPTQTAEWIRQAGSIPYIRLMLRNDASRHHAESTFTLDRIIEGDFDTDLREWARGARTFGSPLIVEYGTEVNNDAFGWNGVWNGGGALDGYGDPTMPDGPERFRDAYRHIITICREAGAANITWVFHANNGGQPYEEWNQVEQYYPGDDWIDWIGVSIYGSSKPTDEEWPEFQELMDAIYPRLATLSPEKPIVVAEFGATMGNPSGDQARWAEAAFSDLATGRWPRVIGFAWWNESWRNDSDPAHDTNMRVQDNPALAAVFQQWVGNNEKILGRLQTP